MITQSHSSHCSSKNTMYTGPNIELDLKTI
jgi:hypothetical protein